MTTAAKQTGHSDETTEGIRVRVGAQFLPDRSDPDDSSYAFVYRVVITNEGDTPAKLLNRHWIIRDSQGEVERPDGSRFRAVVGRFFLAETAAPLSAMDVGA
jgi:ApaG protein